MPRSIAKGLDPAGAKVALPESAELLPSLFAADVGRDGETFDTNTGGYVVGRVDGVTPAALKPLDQVKDQVVKAWEATERKIRQQRLADELVAAVNSGKTIDDVANP